MGRRIATTIKRDGPFFTHDPEKTFSGNLEVMLEAFAKEGEADVRAQVAPHSRHHVFEEGVVGRTHRLDGAPFRQPTAVVSQQHVYDWRVHRSTPAEAQYRGGKFEAKYGVFGRTYRRVRSMRAINAAELLRGLQ
jgi:hypothetical protein